MNQLFRRQSCRNRFGFVFMEYSTRCSKRLEISKNRSWCSGDDGSNRCWTKYQLGTCFRINKKIIKLSVQDIANMKLLSRSTKRVVKRRDSGSCQSDAISYLCLWLWWSGSRAFVTPDVKTTGALRYATDKRMDKSGSLPAYLPACFQLFCKWRFAKDGCNQQWTQCRKRERKG